jgi:hypothetical protein
MFTNHAAAQVDLPQNELPMRPRTPVATDRRPTIVSRNPQSGSLFGGWGPRLG